MQSSAIRFVMEGVAWPCNRPPLTKAVPDTQHSEASCSERVPVWHFRHLQTAQSVYKKAIPGSGLDKGCSLTEAAKWEIET